MSNKNKKRGILNQVEEPIVEETNLVTEEQVVAQEEFINEAVEEVTVENEFSREAEDEFSDESSPAEAVELVAEVKVVEPKEANFNFQETYFIGGGDPDAEPNIDVLPEEAKLECVCQEDEKCDEDCVCKPDAEFETTLEELRNLPDVQVKAPRSVGSLTRAELHRFNTTGILPE